MFKGHLEILTQRSLLNDPEKLSLKFKADSAKMNKIDFLNAIYKRLSLTDKFGYEQNFSNSS